MKTLTSLYNLAEQDRTPVIDMQIHNDSVGAMSVCDEDGDCIIAIDSKKLKSEADHIVKMAHELGHCKTGSFYNEKSPLDIRSKHEYRADKWAVMNLVPYDDFIGACKKGYTEIWQLAEYFGVTDDFILRAHEIYLNMGYSFDE